MKKLFLLLFSVSIAIMVHSQNPSYQQKLYYTCKVWGFVKYYHSGVSICQVNWDSVLIVSLPVIKNAVSNNEFNNALANMLTAAGTMEIATTPLPDTLPPELKRNLSFSWINDPVFRSDVKVLLDTIRNNFRPHAICWVTYGGSSNGYLAFPYDDPMIDSNANINYPSELTRLLVLFKYWNIINYFNPYNYVLDKPWDSTLYNHVISVTSATNYIEFYQSIKMITATLDDSHTEGYTMSFVYNFPGYYSPLLLLRYFRDQYIVVKSGISSVTKGDIIVSIDSIPMTQMEDSLRPYISAGNTSVFHGYMCWKMLCGQSGSVIGIVYKDSLGTEHSLSAFRNGYIGNTWFKDYYPNDTLVDVKWRKWNCNVGYVNMGILETQDVYSMYLSLKNTTAIIFDLRNYPNGTVPDIAELIYPNSICFSKLSLPDINYPGTYSWTYNYLGYNGNINCYQGQVIILCNQQTQSQAEYSCMALRAMPISMIVGSQTAGADGEVSIFHLSQDILTGLTSFGVYYPDGDSTQRIGIVPDSVVYPTAEGIRQGRDEVLEKALQTAGCLVPMFSVTPSNQTVPAVAGTADFIVTSNTNWAPVSDASWCTVTSQGSGNGNISASYTENTSFQPRTANILVTIAGLPAQTITMNQAKSTIGVEEKEESLFRIFPNPVKGSFKIVSANGEKELLDVTIRDLTSKMILEQHCKGVNEYGIDVSSVPQGCYFIILRTNENIMVRKLIIN